MSDTILHVVFNMSAAGTLRSALAQDGRTERVIGLSDSLSFGPIDPPDLVLRTAWVEEELGFSGWDEVGGQTTSFWSEALSRTHRRIAWLTRRSSQEYAGFLEFLWRLGDEPVEMVDLTDTMVRQEANGPTKPRLAVSLALLSPEVIRDNNLWHYAEDLTPGSRDVYRERWARLKADNAPLRILSAGELVSAPISVFDPVLLSCATTEWQKAARIIGAALCETCTTELQTGDLVLVARARALVEAGRLECRGDVFDIHRSELRLPLDEVPHRIFDRS